MQAMMGHPPVGIKTLVEQQTSDGSAHETGQNQGCMCDIQSFVKYHGSNASMHLELYDDDIALMFNKTSI